MNHPISKLFHLSIQCTALVVLSGCGSLPSSGPSSSRIRSDSAQDEKPAYYQMIPVSQSVVETLQGVEISSSDSGVGSLASPASPKPGSAASRSRDIQEIGNASAQAIAVGDEVAVTIFTSGGGIFNASTPQGVAGNSQSTLPPQVVDESGGITVPYAGRIIVGGRSILDVEKQITESLKTKALDPWVIVSILQRRGGDLVTVTGEVKSPIRVPVPLSGLRLLDAITSAGGSTAGENETVVTVTRGERTRSDLLADVFANTKKNVRLQPGDTVIVKNRRWSFLAFGTSGQNQFPFDAPEITLAEALSKAGGLLDNRTNPEAVFVYRFETPSVLEKLGHKDFPSIPSGVPVIYQINLREPKGFFMAAQFNIRNKDIIFAGNAGTVGIMKFLNLINAVTAPARSGLSTASGLDNLGI